MVEVKTKIRDINILIIDDEEIIRKTIKRILQASNSHYYIEAAANVAEALELLSKTYWDTILLDLSLPKTEGEKPETENGLFMLDILCKEFKMTAPVIAMTGYYDDELAEASLDKGAYYFLQKPLKPKSLAAIVNNSTRFQLAGFDGLTGLLNRVTFEERLKGEFERVRRKNEEKKDRAAAGCSESCLSLVFFDGDNFKGINDRYSHLVGDQVLKKIGSSFINEALYEIVNRNEPQYNNIIRPYDVASRFGGDEFSIFLPETNHENALIIAKRIRQQMKEFDIAEIVGPGKVAEGDRGISVSTGIATYPYPNNVKTHLELITKSDIAMYASKEKREGQIFGYNPDGTLVCLS